MKAVLLAKSSSGEPYQVEFLVDGASLRVFCHCPAGVLQQMCKHKLAFLKADVSMLFQQEQSALLSEVHGWPGFGSLKAQTDQFEKRLKEVELAKDALSKREKAIKSEFARGLAQGFK